MKIGILTFHWAANHGAVLQAYALCNYLHEIYHADVEIVNYYPKNLEISLANAMRRVKPRAVLQKLTEIKKDKLIKIFRNNLPLTKRYDSNDALNRENFCYDILITGSDQIWNPYFLMHGENKITPVYYLNFGPAASKRIAISASFGCNNLPDECQRIVVPLLKRFDGISVRENEGKEILASLGFEKTEVTADPTALMSREAYMDLCSTTSPIKFGSVSKFILRRQPPATRQWIDSLCKQYSAEKTNNIELLAVSDWLAAIRDSSIVVTNSFHCVLMCLKLHTPFVVVAERGTYTGMNDRFTTLLNRFGLSDRMICSNQDISKIAKEVNFSEIDILMEQYGNTLKSFIDRNIH